MADLLDDDDDTLEAHTLATTLDPYGQLIKMLQPRASCIAIYDRMGVPLWLSDGCDSHDSQQLVEEALTAARGGTMKDRDGFARSWGGDTTYVFLLRDAVRLIGAVAISSPDTSSGSRPFSLLLVLLRPALQVLGRELANQNCTTQPQDTAADVSAETELAQAAAAELEETDDLEKLLADCVSRLACSFGAVLIPQNGIDLTSAPGQVLPAQQAAALQRMQHHLYAWVQVQRRTVVLNKAPPPNSPLGDLSCKILACPVASGTQQAAGVLMLFKPATQADFDVRQIRAAELVARRIAYLVQNAYDTETGLLTRPAFERQALAILAARPDAQHWVAYADIDRLHVLNENHGMHVGDEVIARIAAALRPQLASDAAAAHISGDRFAVFFADCTLQVVETRAAMLCDAVANLDYRCEGKRLALSVSIGIAPVPEKTLPLSHALAVAEAACKAAKDRGRGRVELYQEADRSIVRRYEDVALIGSLREALATDRFRMDAQPIVDFGKAGGGRRFELLLRMIDPAGEVVAPDKFLVAAERYQLATDIDRWVVHYALEVLSPAAPTLAAAGAHFAINLSGQSVGDESFQDFLDVKLREYALPAGLLSFEITETAAVANIVRAETLIRRLQAFGHDVALDDFGRGLSSLTYLKSLPVTELKIDGGLVRDLAGNVRAQAMVTAIVQLARAMSLRTTAECVENLAIQAAASQLGVDQGQGYAIGRPRPLEIVLQELLGGAASAPPGARAMSRLTG